eukprot:TRINITY_DN31416_c0_g1_i3.p1 TRINITY_DN31416_c0_g1~~TRINITY_DN31416_c0_g1_i3.p1  ORF type:complete len:275 (-),score=40.45 TRINITY_DN31416_c0_g1_i3:40-864(-)
MWFFTWLCVDVFFFFFFKQKTAYEMQRGLVGSEMCIRDRTCIVQRYVNDIYERKYRNTLGVDFHVKQTIVDGKNVEVQISDTAGQERYRSLTKAYYADSHGVILVYDISDRNSFDSIKYWLDDLEMYGNKLEMKLLVGNKSDLKANRAIEQFEAKRFAFERGLQWIECSAKEGENVKEVFYEIISMLLKHYESSPEFRGLFYSSMMTISSGAGEASKEQYQLKRKTRKKKKSSGCCQLKFLFSILEIQKVNQINCVSNILFNADQGQKIHKLHI